MKIFKLLLRGILILYPFFCIYVFFNADKYDNIFWGMSMAFGGLLTIFGGIILIFLMIAIVFSILKFILNWIFERDILD
jgi:hypothetical protein